jgi:hypothetical protein
MGTHLARARSNATRWWKPVYTIELADAYPPQVGLDRFYRQVIYLKPRTLLIVDRLTTRSGTRRYIRRYEWLLHTDALAAEWRAAGDSVSAVHRKSGRELLTGRVFPSYRYFFERQSMDRPDGRPMVRALSATMIGRVPVNVEFAAALAVPRPGDSRSGDWVAFSRGDGASSFELREPTGEGFRAVVFARGDTVELASGLPSRHHRLLIVGVSPERMFALNAIEGATGQAVYPHSAGGFRSSGQGVLEVDLRAGNGKY